MDSILGLCMLSLTCAVHETWEYPVENQTFLVSQAKHIMAPGVYPTLSLYVPPPLNPTRKRIPSHGTRRQHRDTNAIRNMGPRPPPPQQTNKPPPGPISNHPIPEPDTTTTHRIVDTRLKWCPATIQPSSHPSTPSTGEWGDPNYDQSRRDIPHSRYILSWPVVMPR